jgi:hypothetical protein
MEYLSWDLSVLSRAIAYSNLSGASSHIGLSQPQLSRIIAKLEQELGLTLLDRESRRKSAWTPAAFRLAEIYSRTFQSFRAEVAGLADSLTPYHLRIGALEGLQTQAMALCNALLAKTPVMVVELDVLDTHELEERFMKNELDLIFSVREPGRKKYRHVKTLGFQVVEPVESGKMRIHSTFEYTSVMHKGRPTEKAFVSNSLGVRKSWMETYGGIGTLPSPVKPKRTGKKAEVSVLLVAHDHLPESFWKDCIEGQVAD